MPASTGAPADVVTLTENRYPEPVATAIGASSATLFAPGFGSNLTAAASAARSTCGARDSADAELAGNGDERVTPTIATAMPAQSAHAKTVASTPPDQCDRV